MTTAIDERVAAPAGPVAGPRWPGPEPGVAAPGPADPRVPPGPMTSGPARHSVARWALVTIAVLSFASVVHLVAISPLQQRAAQARLRSDFQDQLAAGTAPIGPILAPDLKGKRHYLAVGAPIALIDIPAIGLHQVVVEGTAGGTLVAGPGHLRSTVFPGGAGTSVLLGRSSAYGGPFARLGRLHRGDAITVTTGVGKTRFHVLRVRRAGTRFRSSSTTHARLLLATATGSSFVPSGVLWVDAEAAGAPLAAEAPVVTSTPPAERPLGTDASTAWALLLWLQVLAVALVATVWVARHRSRSHAWILGSAPVLAAGFFVADQAIRLLPNLL